MKASEADLATERQNRLLANREKEVAKQLILKLQEENWGLRKARSVSFPTMLIIICKPCELSGRSLCSLFS